MTSSENERIVLAGEDGTELELYVLEETRLGGRDYLLAADTQEGDGTCYLLKDVSDAKDKEARFVPVEDPQEAEHLLDIFGELLDDVDLEA
ncbi:MAG: DUF1292 domain-containing protein [Lachnospiraceae bacterium]|nr:DUF1292 domain-containing protein [Lachnospiraceae bacterium]